MKLKSKLIIMMLIAGSFLSILPAQKVYAHDAYFLRVLVNEGTMQFEGRVEFDDESFFSEEVKHTEHYFGNFAEMQSGTSSTTANLASYMPPGKAGNSMIFSFPSKEIHGDFYGRDGKNHATSADRARAMEINNVLMPSLNGLLATMNDGKSFLTNQEEFNTAVDAIITASNGDGGSFNGWTLRRNTSRNTITASKTGRESESFVYRVLKGYKTETLENGKDSLVYTPGMSDDVTYMTIGMLASQGNYARVIKSQTLSNLDEINDPSLLESMLGELIVGMVETLEMMLGLYTIDELVFNRGSRMEYGSYQGVMKNGWMDLTTSFFMIFQVVAWSILGVALIKALLEKNLSTMSIVKQISLMSSVQNLLISGFLMTVFFIVVQTMITLNSRMVGIFAEIAPQFQNLSTSGGNGTTIADGVLRFYYFIISIYLNFTYIMRAITIAVLIASAPLFIASIAFSSRGSELFSKWSKELIANLFLQTFHAFVMGMLLMAQIGSSGIEMAVIALAVIPLTKLFKGLIVGEAGGLSGEVAGMASGMAGGIAAGAIGGMVAGRKGAKGGKGGYSKDGGNESDIPGLGENKNRLEHSVDTPDSDSLAAVKSKGGDDYGGIAGQKGSSELRNRQEVKDISGKEMLSSAGRGVIGAAKVAGKAGLKYSGAAAAAVAGAAMMSVGATQGGGKMMDVGRTAIDGANQDVLDGVKSLGEPISNAGKRASNNFKDSNGVPDTGSVLGMEQMDNGDNVIHRSLTAMNAMGIEDAYASGKEQAITYNPENMNAADKSALNEWRDMKNPADRKKYGVEGLVENANGTVTMMYANYGKKQLGVSDIYKAKNRIVETKNHRHNKATQYIYRPSDVKPLEDSGTVNPGELS